MSLKKILRPVAFVVVFAPILYLLVSLIINVYESGLLWIVLGLLLWLSSVIYLASTT